MELRSDAFDDGRPIPPEYTQDGAGISPPLEFVDVPAKARSLALVIEDPDVPRIRVPSGVIDHWLVWNLPPDTGALAAGAEPPGTVGRVFRGIAGYVGPRPPVGEEHRYWFYLYALDTELELPADAVKQEVYDAMQGHVIEVASLMGWYRPRESDRA